MRIVRKAKPDRPPQLEGESVLREEEILNRWYRAQQQGIRSQRLASQVASVLQKLRDRQLWIACECQPDSDHWPLLCPVQLDGWGQRYSWRRIRTHLPHDAKCPLFRAESEPETWYFDQLSNTEATTAFPEAPPQDPSPRNNALRPLAPSTSFILDVTQSESPVAPALLDPATPTGDRQSTPTHHSQRWPKLARMLFTLLEEAQLNIIPPTWKQHPNFIRHQYQRLTATKRHIINRIPLREYLTTQPEAIAGGCRQLERLSRTTHPHQRQKQWPPHVNPQAFFAGIASGINPDRRELYFDHAPRTFLLEEPPVVFTPPNASKASPFWTLAHIGESKRTPGRYCLRQAYGHPVYNKQLLVPVDSDAERQTLSILLEVQQTLLKAKIPITILKPLHDFLSEDNIPYRPDFILYRDQLNQGLEANIIIETMGFRTEEYLVRKARLHPVMAQLGTLIKIDFSIPLTQSRICEFQQQIITLCQSLWAHPLRVRSYK